MNHTSDSEVDKDFTSICLDANFTNQSNVTNFINRSENFTIHNLCTNDTNKTLYAHFENSRTLDYVFMPIHLLNAVTIIVSNCIVIASFVKFEFVRTVDNNFLLSLCISDLLAGLSLILSNVLSNLAESTNIGHWCVFAGSLSTLVLSTQIWTIQLLTIDRWLCVYYPLRTPRPLPEDKTKLLIIMVWTFFTLMSLFLAVYNDWEPGSKCFPLHTLNKIGVKYFALPVVFIPLAVMPLLYAKICRIAMKHARQIRDQQHALADPATTSRSHELKMMKTLGLVLGCLYLSWVPAVVHSLLMQVETDLLFVKLIKRIVNEIALLAVYSGSFLNPLIYHWACPNVRKAMKLLIFPKSTREYYRNIALQEMFGGRSSSGGAT